MSDMNLPGSDDEGIMGDEPPVAEPDDDMAEDIEPHQADLTPRPPS
jgi:hypothetical protein